MKKKQREKIEQRKVTDLVRSIVKLYFKRSGRYSIEEINRKVDESIKRVILKPSRNDVLGSASLYKPEITIHGIDDKAPTFEEIINNLDYYKSTILHEGEHKFFTNRDESGMITGTGLQKMIFGNKDFKKWLNRNFSLTNMRRIESLVPNAKELKKYRIDQDILEEEIGRGADEGLVEWYRVEVLGNKSAVSYAELTSIIYNLQRYLDRKGKDVNLVISRYVDGDYDYMFKSLNMSKSTGIAFIRMLDAMYYLSKEKKENRMDEIVKYYEFEEKGSLQPDFLARFRKQIESLDIFTKLQEEYKRISYRKESFKEFVSKKVEGKKRELSKYKNLAMSFIERAFEREENSQGVLELSDVLDLIDEGTILLAQNMDDIIKGIKISLESNAPEGIVDKEIQAAEESEGKENVPGANEVEEIVPEEAQEEVIEEAEQGDEEDPIEYEYWKEGRTPELQISMSKNIVFGIKSMIHDMKFNTRSKLDDIMLKVRFMKEKKKIKREDKERRKELKREIRNSNKEIKREMKRDRREARRYYDKTGKLALIGLAAATGVSIGALTAYLTGEIASMQDRPNIGVTEPKDIEPMPEKTIEDKGTEEMFPFLNEDQTMSLKAGSTIYRSVDKVNGRTTLAYDYENLIIDSVRLVKNNNEVLEVGDLSNLKEFMDSLGEEGLSIMMRLGVEQNGEKIYIAWCDYAEMLENAKNINDREDVEDMEI